jgi:hypothetical protein
MTSPCVKVRFETADLRCLASELQPCFRDKAVNGIKSRAAGLPSMLPPVPTSTRPTVLQLARAQTFRFLTMLATWALMYGLYLRTGMDPGFTAIDDSFH